MNISRPMCKLARVTCSCVNVYRSASDREVEAQSCFKLTLEYRLNWEGSMYSTRSSSRKREGRRATGNPSAWESTILRGRLRDKQRAAAVFFDYDKGKDLIELIGHQSGTEPAATSEMPLDEAAVTAHSCNVLTESPTKDLNSWLDSSHCSMDGVCSGPSSPQLNPGVVRSYAQGLCLCCQTVLKRARHMRPLKDKLLDTNPRSLSCDQWVLKKRLRPSGLPVLKSKLRGCLKLIKKRQSDVYNVMQGQPACSRAHTFLRRNLRLCTKAPARRGRKRKRSRRSMTTTKRARCDPRQKTQSPTATSSQSSSDLQSPSRLSVSSGVKSTLDSLSEEEDAEAQYPAHSSLEAVPSLVTIETTVDQEARASKRGPVKRGGFKDLLIQMRGNRRMIVREPDHH